MTIRWQLEEVPIRLQDEIEYFLAGADKKK